MKKAGDTTCRPPFSYRVASTTTECYSRYMSRTENLNPAQRQAVFHKDGPLLIVAGAGAGKTKTITERIIHMIDEGVHPESILAVTFTNKAAAEMRERVLNGLGHAQNGIPLIATFHSLGVRIIKEHSGLIGVTKHFTIADESDALGYIKDALKDLGLDPKQNEPRKFRSIISREKGNFVTREDFEGRVASHTERLIASIWTRYEASLKKENALDFDDLLLKAVVLLEKNLDVRRSYQERFKYIHIDEYQDTNEVQYKMTKLLAEAHKNICVVGDGDQNIYGWRGANLKNILNFEHDYPEAKIILLEENYRSTKTIIQAANEIIKKNNFRQEKNLFTKNRDGDKISLCEAYDESEEAYYIAETAHNLVRNGVPAHEVAVLYRANFQSRALEEAFLTLGVPYQVLGVRFFERKEIKDVLCYLRAAQNPDSLSDIKRVINVPARGIGKTTVLKLFSGQKDSLPQTMQKKIDAFYALLEDIRELAEKERPSEVVKFVIKKSGIEGAYMSSGTEEDLERLENTRELATLATKYDILPLDEGLSKLLEDAALASDQDSLLKEEGKEGQAVRLMTVHASKGLEFSCVFITGLEQDLFPHSRMGEKRTVEAGEEERRLFYVAITRAKEKLFLTWASIRTIFGSRQINAPSEFLYDIPEELLEREERRRGSDRGTYINID